MKNKSEEKWIVDFISDQWLEKSVEATIYNNYGKIFAAIFEIKSLIEDLRMQVFGRLKLALDIWE